MQFYRHPSRSTNLLKILLSSGKMDEAFAKLLKKNVRRRPKKYEQN
jgi:hypothetical protein